MENVSIPTNLKPIPTTIGKTNGGTRESRGPACFDCGSGRRRKRRNQQQDCRFYGIGNVAVTHSHPEYKHDNDQHLDGCARNDDNCNKSTRNAVFGQRSRRQRLSKTKDRDQIGSIGHQDCLEMVSQCCQTTRTTTKRKRRKRNGRENVKNRNNNNNSDSDRHHHNQRKCRTLFGRGKGESSSRSPV